MIDSREKIGENQLCLVFLTLGAHIFFFDHEEHSESIWPCTLLDGLSFHNYSTDQLEKILGYCSNIVESIRVVENVSLFTHRKTSIEKVFLQKTKFSKKIVIL